MTVLPVERCFELHLQLQPRRVELRAVGELDVSAAADLSWVLSSTAALAAPVYCDLSGVTFIDTAGLLPFVAATRARRAARVPVRLTPRSEAVQRLLDLHGLGSDGELDLTRWDAARAPLPVGVAPPWTAP